MTAPDRCHWNPPGTLHWGTLPGLTASHIEDVTSYVALASRSGEEGFKQHYKNNTKGLY